MPAFYSRIEKELSEARAKGTLKESLFLESPMGPKVKMEGHGEVLVLSSNNYLGLADHPEVKTAGKAGIDTFGAGTASVRFICGSFSIHRKLEETLARFLKTEAALTYVSCFTANLGLIPTIAGEKDMLISDELNHASIIDACRAANKAVARRIYKHSDMAGLEKALKESMDFDSRFIITDGVFSMEGDIARLPDITALAKKYDALVIVDDSHGTGVMGKTGAGTAEHYGLEKEVDITTSTLGKALGGAAGGFVAGKKAVIDYLFQKSRPMLFSNALPPTVAASALKAVEVLMAHPEMVERLKDNCAYFRDKLTALGYKPLHGEAAIIPVILGDTARAIKASKRLLEKKIFVTGFGFPVVPEGTARIRIQMSAALTREHLDSALAVFKELKSEI